jgi:undecaprenyl-diphosphatase
MTWHRRWLIGSALIGVAVFALMWIGYARQWSWVAAFDAAGLDPMYRIGVAHPAWVTGWNILCTVFGPTVFRLVGVVVIVVALIRRRRRIALFFVVTAEFSGLLTQIAKEIADRPRPATALVYAYSTSFPSGHAVGVMICVLALLAVGLPLLRPALRPWVAGLGVLVIATTGIGRVVLNVHHPSDVLAGWGLGYAYFVACRLLLAPRPALRRSDETPAVPGRAR